MHREAHGPRALVQPQDVFLGGLRRGAPVERQRARTIDRSRGLGTHQRRVQGEALYLDTFHRKVFIRRGVQIQLGDAAPQGHADRRGRDFGNHAIARKEFRRTIIAFSGQLFDTKRPELRKRRAPHRHRRGPGDIRHEAHRTARHRLHDALPVRNGNSRRNLVQRPAHEMEGIDARKELRLHGGRSRSSGCDNGRSDPESHGTIPYVAAGRGFYGFRTARKQRERRSAKEHKTCNVFYHGSLSHFLRLNDCNSSRSKGQFI